MTKHFRLQRNSRRGLSATAQPNVRIVVRRYERARQRRHMQYLPNFFYSCETRTLRVLVSSENLQELHEELGIILRDDGGSESTRWLNAPDKDRWRAAAGLMTIHASLVSPMSRVIDNDYKPLERVISDGTTVEEALGCVIGVARDWAGHFEEVFNGDGETLLMLDDFSEEVELAVGAAREMDAFLAKTYTSSPTTNHASHIASCM